MYNTAYGYAPFTPAVRPYALAPFRAGMIGAADPNAPAAAPSFMDKVKTKLDATDLPGGVQNKYWLGGAAALGLIWYAHKKRMF